MGWTEPGFDDSEWLPVEIGTTDKELAEQTRPAVVELMALRPTFITILNASTPPHQGTMPPPPAKPVGFLVDFGQNVAGVVRLRVPANPKDGQCNHSSPF